MNFGNKNKTSSSQHNIDWASELTERFMEGYNKPMDITSRVGKQCANSQFIHDALSFCQRNASDNPGIVPLISQIGSSVASIRNIEARAYFKERFLEYCRRFTDGALIINDTDEEMLGKAARG